MSRFNDDGFDAVLAECVARIRQGESLASALEHFAPNFQAELAELVPLALALPGVARDPTDAFVARLGRELRATPFVAQDAARSRRTTWVPGWFPGLVRSAALMLVGAVIATAAGPGLDLVAAESLPDSPLYRVKEARERVEVAVARAPQQQTVVLTRQIETRVVELERAAHEGKSRQVIERVAGNFAKGADQLTDRALELKTQGQNQAPRRAQVGLRFLRIEVERIASEANPQVRPILQRLIDSLNADLQRLEKAA